MSTPEAPMSVLLAERVVFDFMGMDLLRDAAAAQGREIPEEQLRKIDAINMPRIFGAYCMGQTIDDIEPILQRTLETAAGRASPWTQEVMRHEVNQGHRLGMVSDFPLDVVEACVEGMERHMFDDEPVFDLVAGSTLEMDEDGQFTGDIIPLDKASTLSDCGPLHIVADSADPHIANLGQYPWLANSPREVEYRDILEEFPRTRFLYTLRGLGVVYIAQPGSRQRFDTVENPGAFIKAFYDQAAVR